MFPRCRRITVLLPLFLIISACTNDQARVSAPQPSASDPQPTPTFIPVDDAARRAPALSSASGQTIELEDDVWQGGYRSSGGSNVYAGRTAVWIYGTATEYSQMRATFEVIGQPFGAVDLLIEGMDSEDERKTPIQILINDVEIYNDENPLPNDDQPLETGTWDVSVWSFEAALLQAGENTIEIRNLATGAFSRPPFFMLDYAEIVYEAE